MARTIRKAGVKEVQRTEIKDELSRYLREGETQEIVITRHGKPAGILIGFESEEDWFEYRLENDPRFFAPDRAGPQQSACRTRGPSGRPRNRIAALAQEAFQELSRPPPPSRLCTAPTPPTALLAPPIRVATLNA